MRLDVCANVMHTLLTGSRQYLHPHGFDDGLKLMEFGQSGGGGTMTALAVLLADGNGRSGGDIRSGDPLVGSWAGNSIVIGGDYADNGKFCSEDDIRAWREKTGEHDRTPTLLAVASELFEDISPKVVALLKEAGEGRG